MKFGKLILIIALITLTKSAFSQNAIKVYDKSKNSYGVFDLEGKQIIPIDFDDIKYINQSFHCFKNGKEGVISIDGNVLLPIEFDSILYTDRAKIYSAFTQGKWMIFNSEGHKLTEAIYDEVTAPHKNKVGLRKKNSFFELNIENGALSKISQKTFNSCYGFYNKWESLSMVDEGCSAHKTKENGLYGYKKGNEWIIKPQYQSLDYTCEFWIARKQGKYGIISKEGDELTEFVYNRVSYLENYAIVEENNTMGVFFVTKKKFILPIKYDEITFVE
ncbi:WG repeat-containing protein [Tenacibaculum mesophilum]|uniref:WG repeat-containing protein n=1 Tax=Tenacibaculum mesophilum TaxID=104268 RepID=UPI0024936B2B|nr:WG repeat-containing protein [Tenacibaculum mesophilum]